MFCHTQTEFKNKKTAETFWDNTPEQEQIAGVYRGKTDGSVDTSGNLVHDPSDDIPGLRVLYINLLNGDWYSAATEGKPPRFSHFGRKTDYKTRVRQEYGEGIDTITPSETAVELYGYYERYAKVQKLLQKLSRNNNVVVSYNVNVPKSKDTDTLDLVSENERKNLYLRTTKEHTQRPSYEKGTLTTEDEVLELCFNKNIYNIEIE